MSTCAGTSDNNGTIQHHITDAYAPLMFGIGTGPRRELALSRAEGCRMAVEDSASSAWNETYRRQGERCFRQARARSTPIQRAMDPTGVAAARALVCSSPDGSSPYGSLATGTETVAPTSESKSSVNFDGKSLILERVRRRESCKIHLDSVFARVLQVRSRRQAETKKLAKALDDSGKFDALANSLGGTTLRKDQVSPREGRGGPAERDGAECELTMDMLSHLGPLQDLTALDLCVEGLTSASLLHECTSLKSLSLNVNRLSSPIGLVVSTSLVRLGLR